MDSIDAIFQVFSIAAPLILVAPFLLVLMSGIIVGCYFLARNRERKDGVTQHPGTSLVVYTLYFLGIALLYLSISLMLINLILLVSDIENDWDMFFFGLSITVPSAIGIFLASRSWKKWTDTDTLSPTNVFVRCNSGTGVLLGGIMSIFWASLVIYWLTVVAQSTYNDSYSEEIVTICVMLLTSLGYLWINSRIFARPLPQSEVTEELPE
jgi:hypothetical protein|tara:strand:+ start:330 stop:959 length:630 start_codon:yes stop_codon:yes gene_type:complete